MIVTLKLDSGGTRDARVPYESADYAGRRDVLRRVSGAWREGLRLTTIQEGLVLISQFLVEAFRDYPCMILSTDFSVDPTAAPRDRFRLCIACRDSWDADCSVFVIGIGRGSEPVEAAERGIADFKLGTSGRLKKESR